MLVIPWPAYALAQICAGFSVSFTLGYAVKKIWRKLQSRRLDSALNQLEEVNE
jgi:hypothetical protein